MQEVASRFDTIWIVGQTFPDWQNAGVVESWAFENLQLIRDTRIADLPVRQFMNWDVQANEISAEPLANFGNFIDLMDVTISQSASTDEITVIVYWRPLEQTETPLTVFMQLVGAINPETGTPIWSQNDHPPQNGRVSTDLWQSNVIYRDVYSLPLDDVAIGVYSLLIGFYDPISNDRLVLADGTDAYSMPIDVIE
jgi:hypothetical protein